MSPSEADQSTGQHLGRYELLHLISRGGMGEIYLARTRGAGGFEKKVVIKRILSYLAEESEFVDKFIDEANIVTHLTHGNIVPVFDMGEEEGELYIAMEYVPGRDLRALLGRCREAQLDLPIKVALFIIGEVSKGLAYAHRKADQDGVALNIVHRDISPSNVIISREGEVKIVDFGIAKAAGRVSKSITGSLQGKFCYMSPEQASGMAVDGRSDIFSAGVVLYELLTKVRPFEGERDLESLEKVKSHHPEPPSSHRPEIPPEIDEIVMKALSKEREMRYAQVDEMERAIFTWLYAEGGMTSREVALTLDDMFPEGFEPPGVRTTGGFARLTLDDVMEAEVDRLLVGGEGIDALMDTATGGLDVEGRPVGTVSIVMDKPALASVKQQDVRVRIHPTPTNEIVADEIAHSSTLEMPALEVPSTGEMPIATRPPAESPLAAPDTAPGLVVQPVVRPRRRWRVLGGALVGALLLLLFFLTYKVAYEAPKLTVYTKPAGATVLVDGKPVGLSGKQLRGMPPGEHQVSVELEGYDAPPEIPVIFNRGDHVRLRNVVLKPREPEKQAERFRMVRFKSIPERAAIYVDEVAKGTTPGKVRISEERVTAVRLVAAGPYDPYTFVIEKGEVSEEYEHDFTKKKGAVDPPDVGQATPEVDAGVGGGEEDKPGVERVPVTFTSKPAGADVFVNNGRVGKTNTTVKVPSGVITVKMVMAGYETATQRLNTRRERSIKMTLKREPEKLPNPDKGEDPVAKLVKVTIRAQSGRKLVPSTFRVNGKGHNPRKGFIVLELKPGIYQASAQSAAGNLRGSRAISVKKGSANVFTIDMSP